MKKLNIYILLLLSFFCSSHMTYAQNWQELGSGSNALAANGYIQSVITDNGGNVYAAGYFTNSGGNYYVAMWNGSTWVELGSGSNALNANGNINPLIIDQQSNIYAAGSFTNGNGKYYVAKWNGNSWSELGSGSNALNATEKIVALSVDASGNVYASCALSSSGNAVYISKWNGSTWSTIPAGSLNLRGSGNRCICNDGAGNLYALIDTGSYVSVVEWNGSSWNQLDTGANILKMQTSAYNTAYYNLTTDVCGNLYVSGSYSYSLNGGLGGTKLDIAKWDGTAWSTPGGAAEPSGVIFADSHCNIYIASAQITTTTTMYLDKWNGSAWNQFGSTADFTVFVGAGVTQHYVNGVVGIAVDTSGNIYAGGRLCKYQWLLLCCQIRYYCYRRKAGSNKHYASPLPQSRRGQN